MPGKRGCNFSFQLVDTAARIIEKDPDAFSLLGHFRPVSRDATLLRFPRVHEFSEFPRTNTGDVQRGLEVTGKKNDNASYRSNTDANIAGTSFK